MKKFIISALLVGCGSGGGGGGSTPAPQGSEPPVTSYAVVNEAALPACDASRDGHLVYVKDVKVFKTCDAGNWVAVDVKGEKGDSGSAGTVISSNEMLEAITADICNGSSNVICRYRGGQIVKFSDGSVFVTSVFSYLDTSSGSDTDENPVSFLVPPLKSEFYISLNTYVQHGDTTMRTLFLVYDRQLDVLKLVYDTNQDNVPNNGDETVSIVTQSNF